MPFLPAAKPVQVLAFSGAAEDDYGNETPGWGAPVTRYVYGWAPAGSLEVNGWRHTVTAELSVFAPPDFEVTSKDRMVVDGDTFEVEGLVEDYNNGPFGFTPGVVVNLRRAEA